MTNILVIEDDQQTRENLKIILEMEGHAVQTAPDGQAGLEMARRKWADLILCDVNMPRLNGYELLRELRSNADTTAIPFLFLTARGEHTDQRTGMNLGADDYLCKPVDTDDLLAAIDSRLLRQKANVAATLRQTALSPDFSSPRPLEDLGLTPRESEVLLWVSQGKANADVAIILGMSEKTVKIHLGHIFEKLKVETRTAAARIAMERLPKSINNPAPG